MGFFVALDKVVEFRGCGNFGRKEMTDTAYTADVVTSIALLIIGILAVVGILPMSTPIAYFILGAGSIYAAIMLLGLYHRCMK